MTDRVSKADFVVGNDVQKYGCYPLVQVHYNSDELPCNARSLNNDRNSNECIRRCDGDDSGTDNNYCSCGCGKFKTKLGLGISRQTGRLQWCPDITCCKFLIIFPVVMLPITLVLILMMRLEGMLIAMQLQSNHYNNMPVKQQQQIYTEDYDIDSLYNDPYQMMINEQLLIPMNKKKLNEAEIERIRRCISFKFGLSETTDVEDHDIMKDARTSFLPYDTTIIPRECLENTNYNKQSYSHDFDLYTSIGDNDHYRARRDKALTKISDKTNQSALHGDASSLDSSSSLKSFWNEQGTKDSIRQAQAQTMKKYIDSKIDPCVDFYKYACGNWEKHHPIPKDKAGFDTFEMLRENLDMVLKELLESNMSEEPQNTLKTIQHVSSNNYDVNQDTEADIVSSINRHLNEELEKQKLRRHIVKKRHILSDILVRYRRHTLALFSTSAMAATGIKRKRFTSDNDAKTVSNTALHSRSIFDIAKALKNSLNIDEDSNDAKVKARNLYKSCINTKVLQKRGIEPLLRLINNLGGWPVLDANWKAQSFDWLNLTAQLRRYNNDVFIVEWVGPDIKNSDENIIQFDQTNLGLPTREYYLQDINVKYLHAYQRFMCDVMHKLGAPKVTALKVAAELIDFETQLASITAPAESRLNVTKLYKRMTLGELRVLIPEIDWIRYLSILQDRNINNEEQIVIYAVDYMKDLVKLLSETDVRIISNYLMWRFVRHRINNVDDRFDDTKQTFYHTLFGREESPSRWKVCIAQVNTNLGMALGSMFVRKYFDENSKQDTLKMTHELQQAFREILKTTDWLDPQTKYLAELKVNAMSLKIGYPDFILNTRELNKKYAGIEIDPEKYFENTINVLLHISKTEQNKLKEVVNKTTWQTAPAIVNAYYSRNKNQIMFPAGILQPPFYHRYFPRSLNFGGIGVVIGHELTHGFDDKGRLFDRNGSIHKWWSDSAIRGFDERARCIIAQYSNYTVGEVGIALNGESTQGENIADNGGIRQAFHAYKKWLNQNPAAINDESLPGLNLTGPQLFFLNFGQVWCGAMRPEAVRNKLNTAIHSPGRFRVIGTVSNSEDFAREFKCPIGSPMNPVHKCSVW